MFDIFYIGENQKLVDFVPFAKQVDSEDQINARTKMYWLVESNIELTDYDIFNFRLITTIKNIYTYLNGTNLITVE